MRRNRSQLVAFPAVNGSNWRIDGAPTTDCAFVRRKSPDGYHFGPIPTSRSAGIGSVLQHQANQTGVSLETVSAAPFLLSVLCVYIYTYKSNIFFLETGRENDDDKEEERCIKKRHSFRHRRILQLYIIRGLTAAAAAATATYPPLAVGWTPSPGLWLLSVDVVESPNRNERSRLNKKKTLLIFAEGGIKYRQINFSIFEPNICIPLHCSNQIKNSGGGTGRRRRRRMQCHVIGSRRRRIENGTTRRERERESDGKRITGFCLIFYYTSSLHILFYF